MSEYIGLKEYARHMMVEEGDVLLISSDTRKMMWDAVSRHSSHDLNEFIDGLIDTVGATGTILFPAYNWDFCRGITFDIRNSPCQTGVLGTIALGRSDFIRTRHPIYSFAVHGALAEEFREMENIDSFGPDSPFSYFKAHNVKNYIIDISLSHCFTFAHFAEEESGCVKHRYKKDFSAGYIDDNGTLSKRIYSMFVRDPAYDVVTTIDPIETDLICAGAEELIRINSSEIKKIYLGQTYDILLKDIRENRSRKLCSYLGQEDE